MLAQTVTTPDTLQFLYLGLGVLFGIMGLFILSIVIRAHNLHRDETVIEQLQGEK